MYLNALEFLEEEREALRPFEALDALTDEQLDRPISDAHDWSGRDLIGHVVGWIENGIQVAKELAVNESSPTKEHMDREWDEGMGDTIMPSEAAPFRDLSARGEPKTHACPSINNSRSPSAIVIGVATGSVEMSTATTWVKPAI